MYPCSNLTLQQLEDAFYAHAAELIRRGEWAAAWMKLAAKLGPLSAEEEARFLKERDERLAALARPKRAHVELPNLDLRNPAFKRAFDSVNAWCAPPLIKGRTRSARLLLLAGGVGNGKKSLASYAAAKLKNGRVGTTTVPWASIHRAYSPRAAVHELAGESGVLILTDFSMGWNSWANLKEDQATALLDLIRERTKRYTIVTTAHTGDELAEVSSELHSVICSATNGLKALVKMDHVPNYTPIPQPEPEEQDMPF